MGHFHFLLHAALHAKFLHGKEVLACAIESEQSAQPGSQPPVLRVPLPEPAASQGSQRTPRYHVFLKGAGPAQLTALIHGQVPSFSTPQVQTPLAFLRHTVLNCQSIDHDKACFVRLVRVRQECVGGASDSP